MPQVSQVPPNDARESRLCLVFADGQGCAFEISEDDSGNGVDVLDAWFRMMRVAIKRAFEAAVGASVVRCGRLGVGLKRGTAKAIHKGLLETHPIRVEPGFEGNPGVEGGAWRPNDGSDDGLVHIWFAAGTEDLPLHVHEFSDRLLLMTSGVGLFHYLPGREETRELRSVVVEAGDAVLFMRRVVHTFTAPLGDLTLLSYHVTFFEFDDTRQFTIPRQTQDLRFAWSPGRLERLEAIAR